MKQKIRRITETAVLLALLVALQAWTKPLGQLVTGSCVNGVLGIATLLVGLYSGICLALLSPILAFLLGIAPQILVVPLIMLGNTVFILLLCGFAKKKGKAQQILGCICSSFAKFLVLYTGVKFLICGLLADSLLASGMLKTPMLTTLPATFSWPQLFTALIGSAVAVFTVPVLRKALKY